MSLHDMIEAQNELQIRSYKEGSPRVMSGEQAIEFIRWNVLALEDELHEALAETGWKPWATSRHINTEKFKGELVDAFHFFMNLWLVAGGDAAELEAMYNEKRERNAKRQRDGYTGTEKCAHCKGELDRPGSSKIQVTIGGVTARVCCAACAVVLENSFDD